ncbi:hypothetical protein HOU49_gp30 [Arthrobacter phage Eileen]|uniref:Uncharacterized protein n=1 Tax=Arthrobacter phage Eileen TaxID=2419956 RepID=A0A3G2KFR3_9CAUD|nr:hypothetical protein HOU49_gp30 [Arthrobacter phage Eileen]AYN57819.1 hypothetical protein PBI_EILEEN_30 [Arthrobacter phage Eileen]
MVIAEDLAATFAPATFELHEGPVAVQQVKK